MGKFVILTDHGHLLPQCRGKSPPQPKPSARQASDSLATTHLCDPRHRQGTAPSPTSRNTAHVCTLTGHIAQRAFIKQGPRREAIPFLRRSLRTCATTARSLSPSSFAHDFACLMPSSVVGSVLRQLADTMAPCLKTAFAHKHAARRQTLDASASQEPRILVVVPCVQRPES